MLQLFSNPLTDCRQFGRINLHPWTDRQRTRGSIRSGSDYPTFGEEDININEVQDIIPSRDNRVKIYNRDDEESKREWIDLQDKLKRTHPEDKLSFNNNNNYEVKQGRYSFDDDPPPPPIVYRGSSENQGSKEWFDKIDKLSDHRDRDQDRDRDRDRDRDGRHGKFYRSHISDKIDTIANMYD